MTCLNFKTFLTNLKVEKFYKTTIYLFWFEIDKEYAVCEFNFDKEDIISEFELDELHVISIFNKPFCRRRGNGSYEVENATSKNQNVKNYSVPVLFWDFPSTFNVLVLFSKSA